MERIQLSADHNISFHQLLGNETRPLNLININTLGVAFARDSFSSTPELNDIISGDLIISEKSYPVKLIVLHINEKNIGCKYIEIDISCKKNISAYLFSELMASTLYQINPKILKDDPDGEQIFLYGKNQCELHLVVKDKKIVKFKISIMGEYLELDKNMILSSGKIIEDNNESGDIKYKGSSLIESDRGVSEETKNRFIKFINYSKKMSVEYRDEMVKVIRNSGR